MTVLYQIPTLSFKESLFEHVSLQPWSLSYKMVFTEAKQSLTEAINDFYKWHSAQQHAFMETDAGTSDVMQQFKNLKTLTPDHVEKLKALSQDPDRPPPGLLNKFLNPLYKGLSRLGKLTVFPAGVNWAIQNTIQKIYTKSGRNPFRETIKKILRAFLNLSQKTGWVASAVLLALGIIQSVLSLPFLGTSLFALTIVFGILRVIADLVNGKTLTYAIGKAVTLYAAGYGAAELLQHVWPVVQASDSATPPPVPDVSEVPDDQPITIPPPTPDAYLEPDDEPLPSPEEPDVGSEPTATTSYQIKTGDTLGKIAQSYGVSVTELMAANPEITNPHLIQPNTEIQIPPRSNPSNVWQGFDFTRYPLPRRT